MSGYGLVFKATYVDEEQLGRNGVKKVLGSLACGEWVGAVFSPIVTAPACSGGWGRGPLPSGQYSVGVASKLPDTKPNLSYRGQWFPWFVRVTPQFKTIRSALLIHPDGGVPGTLGCIGVQEYDNVVFDWIVKYRPTTLVVKEYA